MLCTFLYLLVLELLSYFLTECILHLISLGPQRMIQGTVVPCIFVSITLPCQLDERVCRLA